MDQDVDYYKDQAHQLVDDVINNALRKLESENLLGKYPRDSPNINNNALPKQEDYDMKNIEWLTIEQFNVEKSINKIHDFIKTWEYQESWMYCVDYLGADDHEFDTRHRFRVRWSIPTRRRPIPQATASVYFTFEVSKIKPGTYPVEVYYVFETNRLVHKPGQSRFRETWLKAIIESKVDFVQCTDF